MKLFSKIRKLILQADGLIGKKLYDSRYADYYSIVKREKHRYVLLYQRRGIQTESVSFIIYMIENKQHTFKL
jgi:hypothetical protein